MLPPIYINSPFINFDNSVIPLLKNGTNLHIINRANQEESIKSISSKASREQIKIPSKASRQTKLESLPTRIKRKISSSGIFSKYVKEIMEGKDILLTEALKQLLDTRTLLKEAIPRERSISLEPVQIGSK